MLTDPFSITVSGAAKSMPRVAMGDRTASYQNSDETFKFNMTHRTTKAGRVRHEARFDQRKIVTSPLDSSKQDWDGFSIQINIDRPSYGFTAAEVDALWAAIKAKLDTALITQIYGQES